MNRKKHFLLILVALVLSFTLSFSLFACNRNTGDPEEGKVDENALITNGTFTGVSSETYPKSPSGWSGSAGSTSGSLATPSVQGTDVLNGVINVSSDIYKSNHNKWKLGDANPGKAPNSKDNNILMMNNLTETSYRFSSTNINIEKNSYYKVTVNYKTDDTALANIFILGDAYAELKDKNTKNNWMQFEFYVEGATEANKTISVVLANGWGDKNGNLSKGVVFYDDVTVEKLEKKDDEAFGKNEYKKAITDGKATYSMKQSDTDFAYTTGSNQPYAPAKYSGAAGHSEGSDNAPYSSKYTTYGVLDTTADGFTDLGLDDVQPSPESKNTKMLFINNKERTAYGYRSRVPFVIEAGKTYKVSVMVKTQDIAGEHGAIIRLVKSGATDDTSNKFTITSTNNEWQRRTFNITGNQLTDTQVFIEFWLGEGGKNNSENWVKGTMFIDNVTFNEVTTADDAAALVDETPSIVEEELNVDYTDSIDATKNTLPGYIMGDTDNTWAQLGSIPDSKKFDADSYDFYDFNRQTDPITGLPVATHAVIKDIEPKYLPAAGIMIKTDAGEVALNNAIKMSLNKPTAYSFIIDKNIVNGAINDISIDRSSFYKISMWVRTDLDEQYDGKGLNVKLKKVNEDEDKTDEVIASFDNINTTKIETNNHYTQLTFYVQGSDVEDTTVYLEVSMGSGSRYVADNLIKGDAYITLVNMESITYDDYTKASTSGNTKKNSLVKSNGGTPSVSNGNFSDIDIPTTYDNYTKYQGVEKFDTDEQGNKLPEGEFREENKKVEFLDENGAYTMPTAPTSWSISNKAYLEALDTGIVTNETQFANINKDNKFNSSTLFDFMSGKYENPSNIPAGYDVGSALVISSKKKSSGGFLSVPTSPETCGCKDCKDGICNGKHDGVDCDCLHNNADSGILPVGYTSSSLSLEPNKFYLISVKVKVVDGTASVILNNNNADKLVQLEARDNSSWQTVRFYVNTGLSSTSVKLELYLGIKGSEERRAGTVAFDNASFITIDKDVYDDAVADSTTIKTAFVTDSFNIDKHNTEGGLENPTNWSGALGTNGLSDEDSLNKGVFDKNYTRNDALKTLTTIDGKEQMTQLNPTLYNDLLRDDKFFKDNNFLVINNIVPNAYSFTNSNSSKTLAKNAWYEVSVDVLTYGLKAEQTAYITLKLNNSTYTFDYAKDEQNSANNIRVNTSTYGADGLETVGNVTTYKFYVSTPEKEQVTNVTITLGLGKSSDNKDKKDENFVQGYAFFDNVTFQAIEKDVFEENAKNDAITKKIVLTEEDVLKKPEDEKKDEEVKPENNLMWLYITSGVIGGLIFIVIIVVVLKKYWPAITKFMTKKTGKNMSDYDKNNPNANKDQKKTNKSKNEFKD